jgi:hypothetical protein
MEFRTQFRQKDDLLNTLPRHGHSETQMRSLPRADALPVQCGRVVLCIESIL